MNAFPFDVSLILEWGFTSFCYSQSSGSGSKILIRNSFSQVLFSSILIYQSGKLSIFLLISSISPSFLSSSSESKVKIAFFTIWWTNRLENSFISFSNPNSSEIGFGSLIGLRIFFHLVLKFDGLIKVDYFWLMDFVD